MEIALLIFLLIIFGVNILAYRKMITTCFFRHSHIKLISEIFILLFTIVTFLYSTYANVFFDINNHDNFFIYPINQIQRNNDNFPQKIKINNKCTSKDTLNYIFIIDRTLSTIDKSDYATKNSLLDAVIKNLKNNKNDSITNTIKKEFQIADILLYKMLSALNQNNNRFTCSIIIYNGEFTNKYPKKKHHPTNDIINVKHPTNDFLKCYVDTLKVINCILEREKCKRNTNLSQIFKIPQDSLLIAKKRENILILISDFKHEEITANWAELEYEINKYVEENGSNDVLQLVCLKGSSNNNDDVINATNSLIMKYTTFVESGRYKQENIIRDIDDLCSNIVQIPVKDTLQKIEFYYPLIYGKFQKTNNARITFTNITQNDTSFLFNLKSESIGKEHIALKIDISLNKSKLLIDYPKKMIIDSGKPYKLTFESQNNLDNIFLEISRPSEQTKQKIPIVFKNCLNNGVCYILITLNTLFIILLLFISLFFCLRISKCRCVTNTQILNEIAPFNVLLPVLSIFTLVVYGIKIFLISDLEFSIIWLFFVILFCLFLFNFHSHEKKKKNFHEHCTLKAEAVLKNNLSRINKKRKVFSRFFLNSKKKIQIR